ncbi:MAG: type II toxin-antitoxin system RelE/ParE family toxin [Pseudomonadales bacterium]
MGLVKKTAQAKEDLIDIWLYIARDNPQAADKMLDRFESHFTKLGNSPKIGREITGLEHEWLDHDIRFFPVQDYLIIYDTLKNRGVEVVRVIHAALDYTRILK